MADIFSGKKPEGHTGKRFSVACCAVWGSSSRSKSLSNLYQEIAVESEEEKGKKETLKDAKRTQASPLESTI